MNPAPTEPVAAHRLERTPEEAQLLLDLRAAAKAHANDDLDRAEAMYRSIIDREPQHGAALHLMGVLRGQMLKIKEAMTWFERASEAPPQDDETTLCLASALGDVGQPRAGLAPCERVLARRPGHTAALYLRVELLHSAGLEDTAVQAIEDLHAHLASGRADPRIPVDWPSVLLEQGNLMSYRKRPGDAVAYYNRAAQAGADPAEVKFRLASVGAGEVPGSPPRKLVRSLFNRYASYFDAHLVDHLGYQAPQALARVLEPHRPPGRRLATLDLGCGTGLSGLPVREGASRLVGVDLSESMLQRARERGIYDELHASELTDYLEGRSAPDALPGALPGPFDLVIACDVLNYLGNLEPVHAAVVRVLAPGGLFVYSVERAADSGPGFLLNDSLRYSHSGQGLRTLAAEHDLTVLALQEVLLRKERGEDVFGLVAVLRRGA